MKWILFVARRFSRVDKKTRSNVTGSLSMLGICFGVVTLIVTLSVMNGFQRTYIDSIMEAGSSHLRITASADDGSSGADGIVETVRALGGVKTVYPFYEAQTLLAGTEENADRQTPALIRALPADICSIDDGFAREIKIVQGEFNTKDAGSIIVGANLANKLGVSIGDEVNLLALSGSSAIDMISRNRIFTITGIFRSGYAEINSTYVFIALEDGERIFSGDSTDSFSGDSDDAGIAGKTGKNAPLPLYAVKLFDPNLAGSVKLELTAMLEKAKIEAKIESWQDFNRAFFGALRIEKNMLMLLVCIIFLVVAVNIYNGMCRMVFERRSEIAIFSALGAKKRDIQAIFVVRSFLTGFSGTVLGLILALLICTQMRNIFMFVSDVQYYVELFFTMLFNPQYAGFVRPNPMFWVYASIPARIYFTETAFTCLFGVLASTLSAFFASLNILNLSVSEVLHDE
ncbi:MAG: ABC transporter permease [Treponemataceae bacterium]|nr:MAG: ABC transporter permease [Treponemataceae bacterium]